MTEKQQASWRRLVLLLQGVRGREAILVSRSSTPGRWWKGSLQAGVVGSKERHLLQVRVRGWRGATRREVRREGGGTPEYAYRHWPKQACSRSNMGKVTGGEAQIDQVVQQVQHAKVSSSDNKEPGQTAGQTLPAERPQQACRWKGRSKWTLMRCPELCHHKHGSGGGGQRSSGALTHSLMSGH